MDVGGRTLADLSPIGAEILTTPHDEPALAMYGWDDLAEQARLKTSDVFWLPDDEHDSTADGFDYVVWYWGHDRLLALSRHGRLPVINRNARLSKANSNPAASTFSPTTTVVRLLRTLATTTCEGDALTVTVVDGGRLVGHGRSGCAGLLEFGAMAP